MPAEPSSPRTRSRRGAGEGSVFRMPDGSWRASLDLGVQAGKRKRLSAQRRTRREAVVWLDEVRRQHQRGDLVTERVTVDRWFKTWLDESAAARVRPSTLTNYESNFRLHISPEIGRLKLTSVRPQHLQRLYREKLEAGLSNSSVRHIHATIRRSFTVAVQWGYLASNPALKVDPPPLTRGEVEPLTVAEARVVLNAAEGDRLKARWLVALSLGLRQGEALGLWWEDVDLDQGVLRVIRQLTRPRQKGEKLSFGPLKTRQSRRVLPLPNTLVKVFQEHRDRQDQERAMNPEWADDRIVFASPWGKPLDPSADNRAFRSLLRRAGVRPVRLHDLRHTTASLLLAQGVHPRVVMEMLGHSQISLTMNTYSHVMPSVLQEAAEGIERSLWGENS